MAKKRNDKPGCLAFLFGYTILACIVVLIIDLIKSKLTPKIIYNIKIAAVVISLLLLVGLIIKICNKFNRKYSLHSLDSMDGHTFEYACADILRANGYKNVKVTRGSGDFGVDILAEKKNIKYAVQCKCYSHKLDNKPIQEVVGGLACYGCSKGAVMTNQYFTEPAKKLAKVNNVELWDRAVLEKMISKTKKMKTEPTVTVTPEKEFKIENSVIINPTANDILPLEKSTDNLPFGKDKSLKYSDLKTPEAIKIIAEYQNAETIFIQRKLMLGYPHANKILDEIEALGFIGSQTTTSREIYIAKSDLPQILNNLYYEPNLDENVENISSTIIFAEQVAQEEKIKSVETLLENFLREKSESIIYFYTSENIPVEIVDLSVIYETNEINIILKKPKNVKLSLIRDKFKELKEYINTDHIKYIYPTHIPYTFALRIPFPNELKETIKVT